MATTHPIDLLIVGSGPAGMATALHLAAADPDWARRLVIVDKATHPRDKLCGGGLSPLAVRGLERLGLAVEVPHVAVPELEMRFEDRWFRVRSAPLLRIVERREFDHWLVLCGERREITVRQGEAVEAVRPGADHVEVQTRRAVFRARAVVAADGASSFVRRCLGWDAGARIGRLLQVAMPMPERTDERGPAPAVFDFTVVQRGVQGYFWDFPGRSNGRPIRKYGIFDSRVRPERPWAPLRRELMRELEQRGTALDGAALRGHPVRWFEPAAPLSQPRILLAGDAAGVDPLLAEGIPFALAHGEVAAGAIIDAFERGDFRFAHYRERIRRHPLLGRLPRLRRVARLVYWERLPRWLIRTFWKAIPLLMR